MMLLREFLNRDIDAEQAQEIPSFVPLYASNISILDDGPTITRARPGYIK